MNLRTQILPFFVLALMFLTNSNALGSGGSCQGIDLRSEAIGVARDQGPSGWCGSFVAADLLSHKLGKRISAVQVGVHYYSLRPSSESFLLNRLFALPEGKYDGALLSTVLKVNLEQTACLESSMPDLQIDNRDLINKAISSARKSQTTIFGSACVGVEFSKRLKVSGHETQRIRDLSLLQQQLLKQNLVGALIDAKTLFQVKQRNNWINQTFGDHYVSIVAQRAGAQECEFLIRDSYGPHCRSVPGVECEEGHYWIPASRLKTSLKSMVYLQDEG